MTALPPKPTLRQLSPAGQSPTSVHTCTRPLLHAPRQVALAGPPFAVAQQIWPGQSTVPVHGVGVVPLSTGGGGVVVPESGCMFAGHVPLATQPKVFDEPTIKQHSCVESQPQVSTVPLGPVDDPPCKVLLPPDPLVWFDDVLTPGLIKFEFESPQALSATATRATAPQSVFIGVPSSDVGRLGFIRPSHSERVDTSDDRRANAMVSGHCFPRMTLDRGVCLADSYPPHPSVEPSLPPMWSTLAPVAGAATCTRRPHRP
jgi:hypothetical protein